MLKSAFTLLQQIGKAMMLPVAVLPVAGILLGIGQSHFAFLPDIVSRVMADGGSAVFDNLPILFCVSVAIGLSKNDGVAGMAAIVGYAVLLGTMGTVAPILGAHTTSILGITTIDTGEFGGIFMGALTAALFRRYSRISLPSYLGFFAGKRFVPIVTGLAAIIFGVLLSLIWPPIQHAIDVFSHWAALGDPRMAASLYGVVERLLIPFGLHHIWNVPFFFEIGSWTTSSGQIIHGDINRFFAGDPTAGVLAGGFLFKMWGLPAAALAIWRTASPENRVKIGSLMIPMALTSFLTGITEPIEFSFLFVAPGLYLVHAVLAGACQFLANTFNMHMGFTFSQGFVDFLLFNVFGSHAHNAWLVFVFGPMVACVYYALFTLAIRKLNLMTPGRNEPARSHRKARTAEADARMAAAAKLVAAFGGADNIVNLDSCVTRLRITVSRPEMVDQQGLRDQGAAGVLLVGNGAQAIFGTRSGVLCADMDEYLQRHGTEVRYQAAEQSLREVLPQHVSKSVSLKTDMLIRALGGMDNIRLMEAIAGNRLRVWLADSSRINPSLLSQCDVHCTVPLEQGILHLIMGGDVADISRAFALRLREISQISPDVTGAEDLSVHSNSSL